MNKPSQITPMPEAERTSLNIGFYRKLYLIRSAESSIRAHYHEDEMKTPMHMSMGQEGVCVGVCEALGKNSQALGSYRSHALYLAKTGETDGFFAEMYGKAIGVARGKAGSMHLSSPEHGILCCAAVVASTISVAVGAAFANKRQGNGRIVAAFFGDGAMDAGVFWESLNAACLMQLPILFVCEDNDLAVHTRRDARQGYKSPEAVVSQFDCNVFGTDSTDVEHVYEEATRTLRAMRETGKPGFLRLRWYRYLEHVGINEDFEAGYRLREEYENWPKVDPVAIQRRKLVDAGWLSENELARIEAEIDAQVARSITGAKAAPFAPKEELYQGLFS